MVSSEGLFNEVKDHWFKKAPPFLTGKLERPVVNSVSWFPHLETRTVPACDIWSQASLKEAGRAPASASTLSLPERAPVQVNETNLGGGGGGLFSLCHTKAFASLLQPFEIKIIHVMGWRLKCQPKVLTIIGIVCLTFSVAVYPVYSLAVPQREVLFIHLLFPMSGAVSVTCQLHRLMLNLSLESLSDSLCAFYSFWATPKTHYL